MLSQAEKTRLDRLDSDLRSEADEFLCESGLGPIIAGAGYAPVGSYAMRTMVWRDLDFERTVGTPEWRDHLAFAQVVGRSEWLYRVSCVDAYRDESDPNAPGLYLGLRAIDPVGGPKWKLDLWTARAEEYAPGLGRRATWEAAMTEDARLEILAIKEAACSRPEYRRSMLSVHVYEAVLERNIVGVESFLEWWRGTYGATA